jgi:hypothetical protein
VVGSLVKSRRVLGLILMGITTLTLDIELLTYVLQIMSEMCARFT